MPPTFLRWLFDANPPVALRQGGRYRVRSWPQNMTTYTLTGDHLVPDETRLPMLLLSCGVILDGETPIGRTDDLH